MYILFVLYSFVIVNGIVDMMTEAQCVAVTLGAGSKQLNI